MNIVIQIKIKFKLFKFHFRHWPLRMNECTEIMYWESTCQQEENGVGIL